MHRQGHDRRSQNCVGLPLILQFIIVLALNYILQGLEDASVHDLFIALASKELHIVPLRPPSNIPPASGISHLRGTKKLEILLLLYPAK